VSQPRRWPRRGKLVEARTDVTDRDAVRGAILTVAAQKGGVGKTTLAYELAAVLDGVLIDLDFHGGGATNLWGFDPLAVKRAPLLEALEQGPGAHPPRPKRGPSRPDLVPSHPDLSAARLDADAVAEALEAWAIAWGGRTLIVDTHPGAHWTTDGAVQVADLVVSPIPPGRREVAATEAMLREHEDYPFLLVPSMVPPSPPARWIDSLQMFAQREHVHLSPPISEYRWLRRRMLTSAITRQSRPGARTKRAAAEFEAVARRAAELCLTPTTA
jgi:chromosome partitioning protein